MKSAWGCSVETGGSGRRITVGILLGMLAFASFDLRGQELEPRAYTVSPVGTNTVVFTFARSSGDLIFDPTLPVEDVTGRINQTVLGYFRSVDLFGRSGSLTLQFPYARGTVRGLYYGQPQNVRRSGLSDLRIRAAVNLIGAPAMDLREFASYRQKTNLGLSLVAVAPSGQYSSSRLLNIGNNRWALKPEVGLSHAFAGRWVLDLYLGAWLFTPNGDFLGVTRRQAPLWSSQFHLSYNLKRRLWAALDGNFYWGGRTTVAGVVNFDRQKNSRIGGTVSVPLGRRQSLKCSFSTGAVVNVGGDFTTLAVGWQYFWGRGL